MTRLGLGLALVALVACGRAPRGGAPSPAGAPPSPSVGASAPRPIGAPPSPPVSPTPPPAGAAPAEDDLVGEAPENNPTSETVTIKLVADPARKARVFWGRKDLGLAPLELTRPRRSGPLDLVVVAPGALPLHTRVFTDRDDKLALRLYAESEAPALLGYHPPDPSTSPKTAPDIAKAKGGTRH
jgi:hypothetical protein